MVVAVVVIDVRPAWAEVWVEGQQVGVTPLQRQIKPGRYKIELKNAKLGYHRTVTINPVAGKKVKISDTVALPQGDAEAPAEEDNGDARRRYFQLTPFGKRVMALEVERLEGLISVARERSLAPKRS